MLSFKFHQINRIVGALAALLFISCGKVKDEIKSLQEKASSTEVKPPSAGEPKPPGSNPYQGFPLQQLGIDLSKDLSCDDDAQCQIRHVSGWCSGTDYLFSIKKNKVEDVEKFVSALEEYRKNILNSSKSKSQPGICNEKRESRAACVQQKCVAKSTYKSPPGFKDTKFSTKKDMWYFNQTSRACLPVTVFEFEGQKLYQNLFEEYFSTEELCLKSRNIPQNDSFSANQRFCGLATSVPVFDTQAKTCSLALKSCDERSDYPNLGNCMAENKVEVINHEIGPYYVEPGTGDITTCTAYTVVYTVTPFGCQTQGFSGCVGGGNTLNSCLKEAGLPERPMEAYKEKNATYQK